MDNQIVQDIWQRSSKILEPYFAGNKSVAAYFVPTSKYSDSWVRGYRKGSGFLGMGAPLFNAPMYAIDMTITFKPGVVSDKWEAYTFGITNKDGVVQLSSAGSYRPQDGGELDANPADVLQRYGTQILELLSGTTTPTEPEPQTPESMF